MPCGIADGMDFFDVYEKAGEAIDRARSGGGPSLLECKTYRYYGHYVGDPLTYRTQEETDEVRRTRDPLDAFEKRVVDEGLLDADVLRTLDGEAAETIAAAVGWAEESPLPATADILTDVYVNA
jgi:pyruvate dehydrogenase E1 component alpha subunit